MKVKLAASIAVCFSARRQSSELPAKASIARKVRRKSRAGFIAESGVASGMSDPRNVAHDKKVKQEKEHEKPKAEAKGDSTTLVAADAPSDLDKSITVLSKLKEMEFHSRANIETLAGLTLTIEDELKQKEFSEPIGELYGAQDAFQTKVAALLESYEAHLESLKTAAA